jgi:hypothetical protein
MKYIKEVKEIRSYKNLYEVKFTTQRGLTFIILLEESNGEFRANWNYMKEEKEIKQTYSSYTKNYEVDQNKYNSIKKNLSELIQKIRLDIITGNTKPNLWTYEEVQHQTYLKENNIQIFVDRSNDNYFYYIIENNEIKNINWIFNNYDHLYEVQSKGFNIIQMGSARFGGVK